MSSLSCEHEVREACPARLVHLGCGNRDQNQKSRARQANKEKQARA